MLCILYKFVHSIPFALPCGQKLYCMVEQTEVCTVQGSRIRIGTVPTDLDRNKIVLLCVFVPPSSDDSITHSHSATLTRIPPNCVNSVSRKHNNWHGISKKIESSAENYSCPG